MKKKKLKLILKKEVISNLQAKSIVGGDDGSWLFPTCETHPNICGYTDVNCTVVTYPCTPQTKEYGCDSQYTCTCTNTCA